MTRTKTPLVIALGLGLLGGLLAYQTIRRTEQRLTAGWQLRPVVVAARDLAAGTVLEVDMLARSESPERFASGSMVEPGQVERVVGQRLAAPLLRGDPLMWSHLASASRHERLSRIVERGGRAMSLSISGSRAVSGFLQPADHVDILGTFSDPKDGQLVSVTLLQNVVVLAAGQRAAGDTAALEPERQDISEVTLLVLPEEAEILALAVELGRLRLTLRNPEDIATQQRRRGATLHTLMSGERLPQVQKLRDGLPGIIRGPAVSHDR